MCHDLSFSASTVEFITDLLPSVVFDKQIDLDFSVTSHVLSMSNRKCMVIYSRDGSPHLNSFEWGLIADFMKTPEIIKKYRVQMANARSENVLDKKSAWHRFKNNRCLVAADGIYEHRDIEGWKNKVPYYIKLKECKHLLLPAFYNYAPLSNPETGEMKGTFSILTRPANTLMQQIHNAGTNKHRMPLFMQPEQALQWINDTNTDEQLRELMQYEIPAEQLEAWPVFSIRSTKPRPDHKEKYECFNYEKLPALGNDESTTEIQGSLFL